MRILLFEPGVAGHRLHHVRHIAAALGRLPVQVTLCLAEAAPRTEQFIVHLGDRDPRLTIDASIPAQPSGWIHRASHLVAQLNQALARHRPDRVYVPSGDGISQLLGARRLARLPGLPPDISSEAMILRGGFAYPQPSRKSAIKARLSWAAARRAPWSIVHLLDPLVYDAVRRDDPKLAARARLMPEPVETPTRDDRFAARRELHLPENGRYLACVGLINNRKGCDRLINAFAALKNLRDTDRLLLAGQIDPETIPTLHREPAASLVRSGRIVCIDRTLSNDELLRSIEASDLIVAFYPQHIGSASIAIRAAAQRRPVLASNSGWLRAVVPRFNLGTMIDPDQPADFAGAIESALDAAETFRYSAAAERFVAYHTVGNFQAHWTDGLRRQLGLPRSADWIDWMD